MEEVEDRLKEFLSSKIPNCGNLEIRDLKKATEGFSYRTIMLNASWNDGTKAFSKDLVIRIEPEDTIAVGPCDLKTQFALLQKLYGTSVPVPKVLWMESDPSVLGRPFFVMERIDGEVPTPWNVEGMAETARKKMAEKFVDVLTKIHGMDWEALGLDFVTPDHIDPAHRERERWYRIARKVQLQTEPILTEVYSWLKRNKPDTAEVTLCHGDFRLGNFLWRNHDIVAFLDWEIASISDPMSDLGWLCLKCWRDPKHPDLMTALIEREELYRLYETYSRKKVDPERVFYWEVLGNLHMATILLQAFRGFQEGRMRDLRLLPMEDFLYKPILVELTELLKF